MRIMINQRDEFSSEVDAFVFKNIFYRFFYERNKIVICEYDIYVFVNLYFLIIFCGKQIIYYAVRFFAVVVMVMIGVAVCVTA